MNHIVTFSIDINEKQIVERIEARAEHEVIEALLKEARNSLDLSNRWGRESLTSKLSEKLADKLMEEHGEEIIESVIKNISKRLPSRKTFLEAVSKGVLAEALKG